MIQQDIDPTNKEPTGCEQNQIERESTNTDSVKQKQEKEIIKSRYDENTSELKDKVKSWKPFKDEQESSTNTANTKIKGETINGETKKPIQHDSKIIVEQIW